jgi:hypothetical protein
MLFSGGMGPLSSAAAVQSVARQANPHTRSHTHASFTDAAAGALALERVHAAFKSL